MKRYSRFWADAGLLLVVACAPHAGAAQAAPAPQAAQQDPSLPPPGFGSLRQDQIGIVLGNDQVQVRVIPLDEHVIRLLSPDSWRSLHELTMSRAAQIRDKARARGLDSVETFMVSFFALQPQARFTPDDLNIVSQNTTYRPIGWVPITPRFSENIIEQRSQAVAIYLFEPGVAVLRPFTVTYGDASNDSWIQTLGLLNGELARVLARASSAPERP